MLGPWGCQVSALHLAAGAWRTYYTSLVASALTAHHFIRPLGCSITHTLAQETSWPKTPLSCTTLARYLHPQLQPTPRCRPPHSQAPRQAVAWNHVKVFAAVRSDRMPGWISSRFCTEIHQYNGRSLKKKTGRRLGNSLRAPERQHMLCAGIINSNIDNNNRLPSIVSLLQNCCLNISPVFR